MTQCWCFRLGLQCKIKPSVCIQQGSGIKTPSIKLVVSLLWKAIEKNNTKLNKQRKTLLRGKGAWLLPGLWLERKVKVKSLSRVRLFAITWTVALPGSSVHGIFQVRILEWVAISFSRRSSRPRDWTWVSRIVGRCFTIWATREVHRRTPRYQKKLELKSTLQVI